MKTTKSPKTFSLPKDKYSKKPVTNKHNSASSRRQPTSSASFIKFPKFLRNKRAPIIVFTALFAAVGCYLLIFSHAANTTNTVSYSGRLTPKASIVSYSVTAAGGGTITASASYTKLSSLSMKLVDPSGTTIAAATSSSPVTLSAAVTISTPTVYKVIITGAGNGNFKVTITHPTASASPSDTTAPTTPSGLTASATSTSQINLAWAASTDNVAVTGYNVYRAQGTATPTKLTTITSNSYSDLSLSPSTNYSYYVTAFDAVGNTSESSTTVSATTQTPPDAATPIVTIASPAAGATLIGTTNVTGTASDNAAVAKVEVQIDSSGFVQATGTTNWTYSLNSTLYTNTTHTITARATDTSGNQQVVTRTVSINNNTSSATPPDAQGVWISPEGVTIDVNSAGIDPETGKLWTIAGIYSRLKENAIDLDKIGPNYTIKLQDTSASQTVTSASTTNGVWGSYKATTYLKGVSSSCSTVINACIAYEYGGAWSRYFLFIVHQRNWNPYLNARWTSMDGSVTLAADPRRSSEMSWDQAELICSDYRLLFGSARTLSERPYSILKSWSDVPDPRYEPMKLKEFFHTTWSGQ